MSFLPRIPMRSPQLILPVSVFVATYLGANSVLKSMDDDDPTYRDSAFRRIPVSAVAGGIAGVTAFPFAQIAEAAAKMQTRSPQKTQLQSLVTVLKNTQKPGVSLYLMKNSIHGFNPGCLAMIAIQSSKQTYRHFQKH